MDKSRPEKQLEGCLLVSGIQFPQRAVVFCGKCPNKSTDVGDLAEFCRMAKLAEADKD